MIAKYEERAHLNGQRTWAGTYRNLNNLPHWHFENELLFVLEGEAEIRTNNHAYRAEAGNAFFVPGGDIHFIRSSEKTVLWVVIFDAAVTSSLTDNYALANPLFTPTGSEREFRHRYLEWSSDPHPLSEIIREALLLEFLAGQFRKSRTTPPQAADKNIPAFKKLLDYIDENYCYVTFSDCASYIHLSDAYFSRQFKQLCGIPFTDYLNRVKIEKAIVQLRQSPKEKVARIADQCGFNTIRNFNSAFRKITGYTPSTLPDDYVPATVYRKSIGKHFDPTLDSSVRLPDNAWI